MDIGNGLNKGNLALLYSSIETIKKFVPDANFTLMYYGDSGSHSNANLTEQRLAGNISIKRPKEMIISVFYLLRCFCVYAFSKIGVSLSVSKNSRLFGYYDSDIVVVIGGDTMSGIKGAFGFSTFTPFINILYSILLGKKVVLYGESIGYYTNPIVSSIAKSIFNRTDLIILRDELSHEYISENNITNPTVYVTADSAFLLSPASESRVHEILDIEDFEINNSIIGINASKLIGRYQQNNDQNNDGNMIDILAKVIDNLIENLDSNIIMIPHVYEPGNDDRTTILSIFEKIENKSKVFCVNGEYSPQELKGIIGLCDLFIGARMHSTIASTSMLVPTVGIAYSHKMYGIIGKMLGQEEYILDIKELDYDKLISKIYVAWENREKIRSDLEVRIPEVKDKVLLNGKYVSELFNT